MKQQNKKKQKNGMQILCSLPDQGNRRRLALAGALAVLSALCSLLPMLGLYVLLKALLAEPRDVAGAYGGAWLAVAGVFLQVVFHLLSARLSHIAAFSTLHDIRSAILHKLSRVPQGFLEEHSAGKLKSQIFDDVEKLEMFYGHHYPEIIGNLLVPLTLIVIVFCMDWRIGLALLAPLLIYGMAFGAMGKLAMKNFPLMQQATQRLNSSLVEFVHGMKEIRIFAGAGGGWSRFADAAGDYCRFMGRWFADCRHGMTVNAIAMTSGVAFVFPVAGLLYVGGGITAPEFLFHLFVSLCYAVPLTRIGSYGDEMNLCMQVAARLDELLNVGELTRKAESAESAARPGAPDIVFEQVSFGYGENKVFDKLDLTAPAGRVTALVGLSGSGKSTAAKLVARFWDVWEGAVRIGGRDIRAMSPEDLARTVAFVTQNSFVFESTVLENILLGKPEATREEAEAAARAAQCHDFIVNLPQGYDTMLGSAGVSLSGGERQRIAIARAILKNAPILVLDEASAYCDPDNEDELQKALSALARGKTVIVIAHRLRSVMDADQIVVLDRGAVVDAGGHDELLTRCPAYRAMWEAFERSENWRAREVSHA